METFEGDTIQRPIGELELEIEGQRATVPVVFAEEGEPEAIGRTTLAVMLLEPNLEKGRLELFPYLKGTDAPLDWGKIQSAEAEWKKKRPQPHPFSLSVRSGPKLKAWVLASSRTKFDPEFLEADLMVKFHGKSPLIPGAPKRITNEGAIAHVRIIEFVWRLVAAAKRLGLTTANEHVNIDGEYRLELNRRDGGVDVYLVRHAWFDKNLGSATVPLEELLDLCYTLAMTTFMVVSETNPELIGNPTFRRFGTSVTELWEFTHPSAAPSRTATEG